MRVARFVALMLGLAVASQAEGQTLKLGKQAGHLVQINESVQTELLLTGQQKAKLREEVAKAGRQSMSKGTNYIEAVNGAIAAVLDAKQLTRLRQIEIQNQVQNQPASLFQNLDLHEKLRLTAGQKEQIEKIGEEAAKKKSDIGSSFVHGLSSRDETMEKCDALHRATMEKVLAVFKAEQRQTWDELTGQPFVVRANPLPKVSAKR